MKRKKIEKNKTTCDDKSHAKFANNFVKRNACFFLFLKIQHLINT